ncbi:hypothetical protein [Maribacter sp. 2210JD10-5]|uniref:hypothetical protein n=1 Tax=Maribacter sp. 2210JD10-5 TaxID=3386272 RepID=UPI0039BD61C6
MKKSFLILILLLTTFNSCENEEILSNEPNQSVERESTDIPELIFRKQSSKLDAIIKKTINEQKLSQKGKSILSNVDFESAIKRYDVESGISFYTFPFNEQSSTLRQFVIKENHLGEILGSVVELEPDGEFNKESPMEDFIGWFRMLSLDGDIVVEERMGAEQSNKTSKTMATGARSICSSSITDWYNCRGAVISASTCDYSHSSISTTCSSSGGSWSGGLNGSQDDEFYLHTSTFGNTGSAVSGGYYPKDIVEEKPPSCESFKFKKVGNNQFSYVKGIRFLVIDKNGQKHYLRYDMPMEFSVPYEDRFGVIYEGGAVAESSARALKEAMDNTKDYILDTAYYVGEYRAKRYFEDELKRLYPIYIPGGRVQPRPSSQHVSTVTDYKAEWFGTGNCDD